MMDLSVQDFLTLFGISLDWSGPQAPCILFAPKMLNPAELPLSARKEAVGMVYLRAVAAMAGYSFSTSDTDYDSVDATLRSRESRRYGLDFQVKCSAIDLDQSPIFPFRLSVKNYEELRIDTTLPRLLLVVVVPNDNPGDWLKQNDRLAVFRRCGYWASLRDHAPTDNAETVTVQMPRANVLTPSALRRMMNGWAP